MNLETTLWFGGVGSGCTGPNCGRPKTIYHGTNVKNAKGILKSGLKSDTWNYGSSSRQHALEYAAWKSGMGKKAVVVIKNPPRSGWGRSEEDSIHPETSYVATRGIHPKYIAAVEIYQGSKKVDEIKQSKENISSYDKSQRSEKVKEEPKTSKSQRDKGDRKMFEEDKEWREQNGIKTFKQYQKALRTL